MRYTDPVNVKLRGNLALAQTKINRALVMLGQLRAMLGTLPFGRKRKTLPDGTVIDVIYHHGQAVAIIDTTFAEEGLPPYIYCFYVRNIPTGKKYQVTYFRGRWIAREHVPILGGFTWFAPDGSTVCYGALGSTGVPGITVDNQLFGDQGGTYHYVAAWHGQDGILRGVRATSYQSPPLTFRRRLELYRVTETGVTLLNTLDFQTIIGGTSNAGFATVSADRSRMIYSHFTYENDTNNALIGIASDSNSLSFLGQAPGVVPDAQITTGSFVHTVVTENEYETNVGATTISAKSFAQLCFFGRSNVLKQLYLTGEISLTRDSFASYINGPPRVYEGHINEVEIGNASFIFDGAALSAQNYNAEGDYTYGPSDDPDDDSVNINFVNYDYDIRKFTQSPGVISGANAWYINPTVETFTHTVDDPRDLDQTYFWVKAIYRKTAIFTINDFPPWDETSDQTDLKFLFSSPPAVAELSLDWVADPRGFDGIVTREPAGVFGAGNFTNYEFHYGYGAVTPDNGVYLSPAGTNTDPDGFKDLIGLSSFKDMALFGVGHMTLADLLVLAGN